MSQPRPSTEPQEPTTYELIRAQYGTFTIGTISGTIRWFGYAAMAVSFVVPILLLLPEPVATAYFADQPHRSATMLVPIMLVTVVSFIGSGIGLALIARRRVQLAPVTEATAWKLVGYEDICSGFGIITGGLGLCLTLLLSALGYLGVETYNWLVAAGVHPYGELGLSEPTVATVGLGSIGGGIVLLVLSRYTGQFEADPTE